MTIKAIIFDLDGTLAEFNLNYKIVRAEVIQFLMSQGFPRSLFTINESIFEMLKKADIYMKNNKKEEQEYVEIRKQVLSIANKHEIKAAHETSLCTGVFETLKELKKKNFKLAIFTINGKKPTDYILTKFRLKQFFDAVITREAVSNVKPDPSHLAVALKAINVNPREAIVVGDNIVDVKSAKALNVKTVGLAINGNDIEKLKTAGAQKTIDSITNLPTIINEFNNSEP